MQVRWMIRRDLAQVTDIERDANWRDPWSEETFLTTLKQQNCIGMVSEDGETIDGYMLYLLHKDSLAVIRFEATERDAAEAMFDKLIHKLRANRRKAFTLYIRETDMATLLLLKNRGAIGVAVDREYFGPDEDAIVMEYRLDMAAKVTT